MTKVKFENIFISLTKWEIYEYNNNIIKSYIYPNIDSQDSWIFLSPISENYTKIPLTYLGEQGCDQVYHDDRQSYIPAKKRTPNQTIRGRTIKSRQRIDAGIKRTGCPPERRR